MAALLSGACLGYTTRVFSRMTRAGRPLVQQQIVSWLSRMRTRFPTLRGLRLRKAKSLHFVTINGQRFKRLQFADSAITRDIERNLEAFQADDIFPRLVTRYEHEIWVDFIDGEQPRQVTEQVVRRVAEFYTTIYTKRPTLTDTTKTTFPVRLVQDLRFLHQVGVLSDSLYAPLQRVVEQLVPPQVWIGFDYTDPVLKNFVLSRENGRLYAIDVEGLADNQLIGMGTTKASVRWLGKLRPLFYTHLTELGAPDFRSYLPFVELCFLTSWTKRNLFEGKKKKIDPGLFEQFCERY